MECPKWTIASFRITKKDPYVPAEVPSRREVGIELARAIDEYAASFQFAPDISKSPTATAESDGIVAS
jgi:hypothetical protein